MRFAEGFLSLRPAPWMVGLVNCVVFINMYLVLASTLDWRMDWISYLLGVFGVMGFRWHQDFWRKRT